MKKEVKEEKQAKNGFFKKVWYSITKIEKYPDMAAEGLKKAITYLIRLIAILAIIVSLGTIYQINNVIQEGISYLKNDFPEMSYNDGILTVESENEVTIPKENSIYGTIIINTNDIEEAQTNQYVNTITQEGKGIVILKDKLIIKTASISGTTTYNYKETFEPAGIKEFNKQTIVDYATGSRIISVYLGLFLMLFIYALIMYIVSILIDTLLLSFFGYITTKLAKIKMRYVAIFNMSAYALTLSILLNMIYIAINIFVPFTITYFQVMYVAVAAIYLVAAILILKSDIINKQMEVQKIVEVEKEVKEQIKEEENKQKQEKEKKERKKKDKEKEEKENNNVPDGPEGSKA